MQAILEEVKKPQFVSHQDIDGQHGLADLPRPRNSSKRVSVETDTIRQLAQHRSEDPSARNEQEREVPYLQDQASAAAAGFDPKMTQLDEKLQALRVQTQWVSEAQAAELQSFKQQTEEKFMEQAKNVQDLKDSTREGLENLSEQMKWLKQQAQQDQLEKHRYHQFISDTEKSLKIESAKTREECQQAIKQHRAETYKMIQKAAEEQRLRQDKDVQILTELVEKSTTGYQEELSELKMKLRI